MISFLGQCEDRMPASKEWKQHHTYSSPHLDEEATAFSTLINMNWAPCKTHVLKPQPLGPQNVTAFGVRAFKDVIKLKWSC